MTTSPNGHDPSADHAPVPASGPAGRDARPVLRRDVPLLWRADDCIEVGDGPSAVVVHGVDRTLVAWARGLDGLRTTAAAVADAAGAGIGPDTANGFLAALRGAGALDDASITPDCLRTMPPEARLRLAPDVAAAGHVHGDPQAAAAAIDRRAMARVRVLGTGRVADAAAGALRAAGVPVLLVPDHGDDHGAGSSHLDVLADAAHPDVPDDHGALAANRPHLPVSVHGRLARVGPLVLPGTTACLRCADLHRRDRDPAWPRLAVQLAHRRPPTPPVDAALAIAAGALAAVRVVSWVESPDGRAETGQALELTLPEGRARTVAFPPHPLCGCLWRQAG